MPMGMMPARSLRLVMVCAILSELAASPSLLPCERSLTKDSIIMGSTVSTSSDRQLKLQRQIASGALEMLACGATVESGETLYMGFGIHILSSNYRCKMEAVVSAGPDAQWGITGGECAGQRKEYSTLDATPFSYPFVVPASGKITLRAAWASGRSQV